MSEQPDPLEVRRPGQAARSNMTTGRPPDLRRLVGRLRWLVPLALALTVVVYDLTIAPWIIEHYGYQRHLLLELFLFGTVGPLIAFVVLELFGRWLDERDTADYQAQLLAKAREEQKAARQISDDTFQTLYATSILLGTLSHDEEKLPEEAVRQLSTAQQALRQGMSRLHAYLSE